MDCACKENAIIESNKIDNINFIISTIRRTKKRIGIIIPNQKPKEYKHAKATINVMYFSYNT
jgi:hypothetical protein